ncbi:MAG: DUF4349 domain-containing protein [Candidatus Symbiothrix sp.]|nr:DUF4349 domain-containing protein [Candidatus Symbiothrix sp.]
MKNRQFIIGIALAISFFSCSGYTQREADPDTAVNMMEFSEEKSAPSNYISSSVAVENTQDTTRKFIRTADLKFKVKDVIHSTYDIEEIANRQGGFVTFTQLTGNIDYVTTTAISLDSSLISTYYTTVNSLVLRVPNVNLDTTLREIARNIDFLDYRTIKAEDVALDILANTLTQKRNAKNEERLINAIDSRGKKLKETTSAEELLLNKQEQADNAKIANLSLADQINFSTVNVSIYQQQTIRREIISNDKNITAYKPNFGSKLFESIQYGWDILANTFLFIIKLWGFILFGILVYIVYKKYGYKLRKNK